jgi:uncharacterized protein YrzB (UPF0473 family)
MEEERDLVVFSDDDGNEFELEIVDYFDYEDQEYAVLVDPKAASARTRPANAITITRFIS